MSKDEFSDLPGRAENEAYNMADFDEAEYFPYLDGLTLDTVQKGELIRIIWDIMRMFVETNTDPEIWGPIIRSIIEPSPRDSGSVE